MSIVAWDGKSIAADRQGVNGDMRMIATKLRRFSLSCGTVLGWVGIHEQGIILMDWWKAGRIPEQWPKFQENKEDWTRLIVANKRGVDFYGQLPIAISVQDSFMAWGSGRDFAMGAMAMGATAKEAVEVACRFCIYCGMGVDVLDWEDWI